VKLLIDAFAFNNARTFSPFSGFVIAGRLARINRQIRQWRATYPSF
jgi:hypothetical protein